MLYGPLSIVKTLGIYEKVYFLSLIFENAVLQGIIKKEGGGTVIIADDETEEAFIITVSDDGEGVCPAYQQDGRTHVGLKNVAERVKAMGGGQLQVESLPGKGTRVNHCNSQRREPPRRVDSTDDKPLSCKGLRCRISLNPQEASHGFMKRLHG